MFQVQYSTVLWSQWNLRHIDYDGDEDDDNDNEDNIVKASPVDDSDVIGVDCIMYGMLIPLLIVVQF